jgi:hypothetical protein
VTWREEYLELIIAEFQWLTLFDIEAGLWHISEADAEHSSGSLCPFQYRQLQFMNAERDVILLYKCLGAKYVIEVSVSVNDSLWLQVLAGEEIVHCRELALIGHARIYDPALVLFVGDDVGVLFKSIEGKEANI